MFQPQDTTRVGDSFLLAIGKSGVGWSPWAEAGEQVCAAKLERLIKVLTYGSKTWSASQWKYLSSRSIPAKARTTPWVEDRPSSEKPVMAAGLFHRSVSSFLKVSGAMSLSEVNRHLYPPLQESQEGFSTLKTRLGLPVQAAPRQSCQ